MSDVVYDFIFPRQALGLDVVVTDKDGDAVSVADPTLTLTLSNGNTYLRLTLDDADAPYSGAASSAVPDLGQKAFSTVGVPNLPASIAAGGGGGGDLSLVAEEYYAEMGSAQDANGPLVLDSFSDGLSMVGDNLTGLPAGYYRISAQVECTRPAELHALTFAFGTTGDDSTNVYVPTISIYPDGTGAIGKNADFQIHIPVAEGAGLQINATSGCVDGTVTPDPLELSYAYFGITRIG